MTSFDYMRSKERLGPKCLCRKGGCVDFLLAFCFNPNRNPFPVHLSAGNQDVEGSEMLICSRYGTVQ